MSVAVVLRRVADADDFDFFHLLEDAAFDTTGHNRATTFNVEHVFHRHQERLIDRPLRHGDVIIHRIERARESAFSCSASPSQRLERATSDDRNFVAGKFVLREEIAHFHLDEIEKFRIVHHVDLVQEDDDGRDTDLTGQQDVLTGLRHRAVRRAHHQDGAVHLRRAGDHVLDIVSVAGAIDVGVVALVALIFDVRGVDRDPALLFFRRAIDRDRRHGFGEALLRQHAGDRGGQSRLAVVNVTNCADVHVRLIAFELLPLPFDSLCLTTALFVCVKAPIAQPATGAHDRD